ncbi:hypothetical protein CALCODRAFT_423663, partial [Calocera cornea HHB12733]
YGAFLTAQEWELAKWFRTSGISNTKLDALLDTALRNREGATFHNSRSLFQLVDSLPQPPSWICKRYSIESSIPESPPQQVEMFHRDPIEVVRELLGNPLFANDMKYTPRRVY